MQINYSADALASLMSLTNYIEATNSAGAGIRWLQRYEKFLTQSLAKAERTRICHNLTFATLGLKCITSMIG